MGTPQRSTVLMLLLLSSTGADLGRDGINLGVHFKHIKAVYVSQYHYNLLVELDPSIYDEHMKSMLEGLNKIKDSFKSYWDPRQKGKLSDTQILWEVRISPVINDFSHVWEVYDKIRVKPKCTPYRPWALSIKDEK